MKKNEIIHKITNGEYDGLLSSLYGERLPERKARIINAVAEFCKIYGEDRDLTVYSVPGRSELSGNHTDHNKGKVIASSIDLDIVAVVAKREDGTIRLQSAGFREDVVDIDKYTSPDENSMGKSRSLIAGMAAGFRNKGYSVCGFDAYTVSNVLKGSGLSSSAAFEVMVGNILNHLCNDGKIDNVEIAKIAKYAENEFFGKPCGLMDQVACAHGGIVSIDFEDTDNPVVKKVDFDISGAGYRLCIVDTGGSHADLTDDYASVPAEMKAVAKELGCEVLREAEEEDFILKVPSLREKVGDRAVLRAFHFFNENKRVEKQTKALENGDIKSYFNEVIASGRSSFCYLQNAYSTKSVSEQGIPLALCILDGFFENHDGAWRLQGGGFAGTVQAYVKESDTTEFRSRLEDVFGEERCYILRVRKEGAIRIL